MIKNQTLQQLLEKEVSRKDFLKIVLAIIFSVVGLTNFLNNLDKLAGQPKSHGKSKIVTGYGSNPYGT